MASDLNHVLLQGRLTKSAEVKYPRQDFCVVSFTIASNKNHKNGDNWEKRPNYIDCTWTGNYAKACAQSMTKGREVFVEGNIHQDRWEKDGQKQSRIIIKASDVKMGKMPGEGNASAPAADYPEPGESDMGTDNAPDDIPF